jgi:hypothetical protein
MGRVDLRKVLGEENPADLLTKHGLSYERLDKLVKLHGCGYRDGRSGLAPLARTGKSDRITMANAEKTAAEVSGNAKDSDGSGTVHGSGTLRECHMVAVRYNATPGLHEQRPRCGLSQHQGSS